MKTIIVTTSWDDGHILDIKLSKLLSKYHIKGTFYISPQNRELKKNQRLSPKQIQYLAQTFEIGAHTMTHPKLNSINDELSNFEILESKRYLSNILKKEIKTFCYPCGNYRDIHIKQVQKAGYVLARTTERFAFSKGKNPFELPTTIHAYKHFLDFYKIAKIARFNPYLFLSYYFHWDKLAIACFDKVTHQGGIFHLWGHSWEIEANSDWERLERVLRHIHNRKNIIYAPNSYLYEN